MMGSKEQNKNQNEGLREIAIEATKAKPDPLGTYARLGFLTQRQISQMEIPESEEMIAREYKIGIIGEMQSGKSLLALRIGQDLVEGKPILGYFPWDKKWRVLYINLELPENEIRIRFSLFGNSPDYLVETLPAVDLVRNPKPIIDLLEARKRSKKPIDVLIIDPKYLASFGTDENQTKDMTIWCAACDKIIKEYNLCMIIVHHFGRETNAKGGRGNTSFGAWLTKRLELKKSKYGEKDTHKCLWVQGKVGEPLKLEVALKYPKWEVDKEAMKEKETKIGKAKGFILTHIPANRTDLLRQANLEQIAESSFKEAQKRLEKEGKLEVVKAPGQGNRKRLIRKQLGTKVAKQ